MAVQLPISNLVNVQVLLSPLAIPPNGFGTLLIIGDSLVIDGSNRYRSYSTLAAVATDFGTSAPEYIAAALFFGQSPQPSNLMIGRWLSVATAGFLTGGILSAVQQTLATWTAITTGSFKITIDGVLKTVTGLNFSGAANLNAVATLINASLTGGTIAWNGSQFTVTSATTGVTSLVTNAIPAGSGTDISTMLQLTAALALPAIPGYALETPVTAVSTMQSMTGSFYGVTFACGTMPTDNQLIAVAGYVQAAQPPLLFGVTEIDPRALTAAWTTDKGAQLFTLGYTRTCVQYSLNPFAVCSLFGRAFSVDFTQIASTITLMYKQEPGVAAESLTTTQAAVLQAKRMNVFVNYQNGSMILQNGVMSGSAYFDEIHGLDWFANALQTALFNLLYTSTTKIPQTDAGVNQMVNVAHSICDQAVVNGLVSPGTWTAAGFGQLKQGQFLKAGFYIYTQPLALQAAGLRQTRVAPPMTIALKLAGAIHSINALVNVNR
jgi:Protein of unknown function (DUF3383)